LSVSCPKETKLIIKKNGKIIFIKTENTIYFKLIILKYLLKVVNTALVQ
jgi:hypothetical protein